MGPKASNRARCGAAGSSPQWWTPADAEGNEVDIATWLGRE